MAALAIDEYTGTPDELLKRAQQATERIDVPAFLLAAVNKRLAEIAPGEEPHAAAKHLAVEWERDAIESGYDFLTEHYDKSRRPSEYGPAYELIDHEEFVWVAESMLRRLKDGNA